jgi:Asp-tRNA(Asn)/Glu-tRNA(Gln) amidotransferase A subunit family amidase
MTTANEPKTIVEASSQIQSGKLNPVELLDQCLRRIDQLEEKVHAWVFVARDEARQQAESLTKELKEGKYRGPLHGIPIGVKDIFDVFDWPTAAGSKLWANSVARRDCLVVEKLRQAGTVFVGKTVTTPFASFDPPPTRNPWNLSKTPGGSSSGSAAAVACGMCLGALASQTGGSIARPAAFCGVYGFKPTYDRVNVDGVVPLAHSMDHIGVIGNCVTDLAIMMQTIADAGGRVFEGGVVPESPELVHGIEDTYDYIEVGRLRGLFDDRMDPIMRKAFDRVCIDLRNKGLTVWEFPLPAAFSDITQHHANVMAVECAMFHESRFRKHPDDYPPKIRSLIETGLSMPAPTYAKTKEHQRKLKHTILESFLDGRPVAITPATIGTAVDAETTGDPVFNSPWSYVGLPTISLPFAWTEDGLPLALQLVARPWEEAELLQVAAWCERRIGFERRVVKV